MRTPVRVLLVAGVATAAVVGGGVLALGGSDEPGGSGGSGEQPFTTTPLASYDTTSATVARAPFCDSIDDRLVDAVLGSVPDPLTWENGDEVDLGTGQPDVVHEFGCSYAVQDVGEARAWVFAPPVDAAGAQRLVRSAGKAPGCEPADGPAYGDPTLALTCTKDGVTRASYRGLFGDGWLVCEVVRPAGATWDAADRAGRWCVGVLEAASTGTASG